MATVKDLEKRIQDLEREIESLKAQKKTEIHNHYHYPWTQPQQQWPYYVWYETETTSAAIPGPSGQTYN